MLEEPGLVSTLFAEEGDIKNALQSEDEGISHMDKMKIDFDREREWWDAKAHTEEQDIGDKVINRAFRYFSGPL